MISFLYLLGISKARYEAILTYASGVLSWKLSNRVRVNEVDSALSSAPVDTLSNSGPEVECRQLIATKPTTRLTLSWTERWSSESATKSCTAPTERLSW